MSPGQIFKFLLRMKRRIVQNYGTAAWNRLDQNFSKPLGKKRPRHARGVTKWRDNLSPHPARNHVRSLKMFAAFDIVDFFPAKRTSKLAYNALIHTALVNVNTLFFRYYRQVLQEFFPFFFGLFSISERLFFNVIPIFFKA